MKNKQKFTLVYAAPGFFDKLRKGKKDGEPSVPDEPEYPSCYDEEPEMKRDAEEFVCVYASPEWFAERKRERERDEFREVYASPEFFAGRDETPVEQDAPEAPAEPMEQDAPEAAEDPVMPEPKLPKRPREPIFRALYAAPSPIREREPLFEKVYAGPRPPKDERFTIEPGRERCKRCGYPTVAGAKYCFNCGARLTNPGGGCVEI
ncbi:MAG: hypothetical protein K6G56_03625 [Clostridiales bacterium]|nr:hypothetical protein [Clostridiales bacterium]